MKKKFNIIKILGTLGLTASPIVLSACSSISKNPGETLTPVPSVEFKKQFLSARLVAPEFRIRRTDRNPVYDSREGPVLIEFSALGPTTDNSKTYQISTNSWRVEISYNLLENTNIVSSNLKDYQTFNFNQITNIDDFMISGSYNNRTIMSIKLDDSKKYPELKVPVNFEADTYNDAIFNSITIIDETLPYAQIVDFAKENGEKATELLQNALDFVALNPDANSPDSPYELILPATIYDLSHTKWTNFINKDKNQPNFFPGKWGPVIPTNVLNEGSRDVLNSFVIMMDNFTIKSADPEQRITFIISDVVSNQQGMPGGIVTSQNPLGLFGRNYNDFFNWSTINVIASNVTFEGVNIYAKDRFGNNPNELSRALSVYGDNFTLRNSSVYGYSYNAIKANPDLASQTNTREMTHEGIYISEDLSDMPELKTRTTIEITKITIEDNSFYNASVIFASGFGRNITSEISQFRRNRMIKAAVLFVDNLGQNDLGLANVSWHALPIKIDNLNFSNNVFVAGALMENSWIDGKQVIQNDGNRFDIRFATDTQLNFNTNYAVWYGDMLTKRNVFSSPTQPISTSAIQPYLKKAFEKAYQSAPSDSQGNPAKITIGATSFLLSQLNLVGSTYNGVTADAGKLWYEMKPATKATLHQVFYI